MCIVDFQKLYAQLHTQLVKLTNCDIKRQIASNCNLGLCGLCYFLHAICCSRTPCQKLINSYCGKFFSPDSELNNVKEGKT